MTYIAYSVAGVSRARSAARASRRARSKAIYNDDGATLEDLRESVETLEDVKRIARRVFGGAHPLTTGIESSLQKARVVHRVRSDGGRVKFI